MPTYRYACDKCGNEFEIFQNITDPPKKRCPQCGGKVYRVIYPVNHILKGTGFYKTDYRDEDFSKREKEERDRKSNKSDKKAETAAKPDSSGKEKAVNNKPAKSKTKPESMDSI